MQSVLFFFLILSFSAKADTFKTPLKDLTYHDETVREDFKLIMKEAGLTQDDLTFKLTHEKNARIKLVCTNVPTLYIGSLPGEETSILYKGLRELGFYFPHPLRQISPTKDDIRKLCGRSWNWMPTLKYRGFHLHTLHPSEWVAAFYQNKPKVAEATIRWLARNQQNIFDLSLLTYPISEISRQMKPHFELARKFQIHTGVSLGIALNQQNSYKLLSLWDSYFGSDSSTRKKIEQGIEILIKTLPLSYVVLEAGSSEFTPTDFEKTLNWLNISGEYLKKNDMVHFTKVHVSSNQVSSKWGNYNFLPKFAKDSVGVLPHTVMFYGIVEPRAPMYGNKDFYGIRDFMLEQKEKRPTWYYPETSYWVAMDMDIPLFLTDYLRVRSLDMKYLFDHKIEGQLNFSSGQALGYWLIDWNVALMADGDYNFNPLTTLRLLGEDTESWKKLMAYQEKWYTHKGIIAMISSANLQDELSSVHRIHDRFTMSDLSDNRTQLKNEIDLLTESLKEMPDFNFVKDEEIKKLLLVTKLRQTHALLIREALYHKTKKDFYLKEAASHRIEARGIIHELSDLPTNYPELMIFKQWKNPTAYQFGYVYPAASLYFWEREETQVKENSYFPFWGNMYDVLDIVF